MLIGAMRKFRDIINLRLFFFGRIVIILWQNITRNSKVKDQSLDVKLYYYTTIKTTVSPNKPFKILIIIVLTL